MTRKRLLFHTTSAFALACSYLVGAIGALSASPDASAEKSLQVKTGPSSLSVLEGENLLLEYTYVASPFKPYAKHWCTPRGTNVLRDAPHDHLHHHALMYAIGIDGVDFWSEGGKAGRQVHRGLEGVQTCQRDGFTVATFTQKLDWVGSGEDSKIREQRTLEVYRKKDLDASLLTWRARFEPQASGKPVELTGRHYFGLGMRFVVSMDKGGRFFNPSGKPGEIVRGTEKLTRARWCAFTAKTGDKPVTVAMFDHTGNVRHPATWFTMTAPFAYLSATLDLYRKTLTIPAGRPLELCYGVALWDGEVEPSRVEELYRKWLKLCSGGKREP